jgi:hypothetical protein
VSSARSRSHRIVPSLCMKSAPIAVRGAHPQSTADSQDKKIITAKGAKDTFRELHVPPPPQRACSRLLRNSSNFEP